MYECSHAPHSVGWAPPVFSKIQISVILSLNSGNRYLVWVRHLLNTGVFKLKKGVVTAFIMLTSN